MNKVLTVTAVAIVVACAVVAALFFMGTGDEPAAPSTPSGPAPPQAGPDRPLPETVSGKQVSGSTTLTRKFFEPSEITVSRNDIVNLYVTALSDNLSVFVPSSGERVTLSKSQTQLIAFQAASSTSVLCVDGCEPGVALTVTVQ